MGILFSEIYTKAVALFDDPQITKAYQFNRVLFEKKMYTYLQNAIAMFNMYLWSKIQLFQRE